MTTERRHELMEIAQRHGLEFVDGPEMNYDDSEERYIKKLEEEIDVRRKVIEELVGDGAVTIKGEDKPKRGKKS